MAYVVRCPLCACIYPVTAEELGRGGGTLRCGIWQTRFNAGETLREIDDDVLEGLLSGGRPEPRTSVSPAPRKPSREEIAAPAKREPREEPSSSPRPALRRISPPAFSGRTESRSGAKPAAVRRKSAFWPIGCVVLLLVLAWQLLSIFGPALGRHAAPVFALRQAVCGTIPCPGPGSEGANPYAVEDFVLEPKAVDSYEIRLSLVNSATRDLELPLLEVTFADQKGIIGIRRVMKPEEYAGQKGKEKIPAAGSLPVRFTFTLTGGRPASCTVRAVPRA